MNSLMPINMNANVFGKPISNGGDWRKVRNCAIMCIVHSARVELKEKYV